MNWITTAIISTIFIALSNVIAKFYQSKIPLGIGMIYFTIGVFVISVIASIVNKSPLSWSKSMQQGALLAFAYGFIWAIGQVFFLLSLSKNAPLSLVIPVLVGGIGMFGVLSGVVFFNETLSLMRVIGIVTVLIGTVILSR